MTDEGAARIAAALDRLSAAVERSGRGPVVADDDIHITTAQLVDMAMRPTVHTGRCPDCGLPATHAGWCLNHASHPLGR